MGDITPIQQIAHVMTPQNVAASCTSLWCIVSGFLMDIKDALSVISILVGILVGVTIIILNIKKMRQDKDAG